jgi:transposase-like protein
MSTDVIPPAPKSRMGGKRPGAGGPFKPLNAGSQSTLANMPPALRKQLAKLKALGMSTKLVIFELYCRQGRSMADVAAIMGMSYEGVRRHWVAMQADLAAAAPTTPERAAAMREETNAVLQATIEATFSRAEMVDETGKATVVEMPASPQMLAVRLKALDQRAKLYGLNLEQVATDSGPKPYQAPEEVSARVTKHLQLMYNQPENQSESRSATGGAQPASES